MSENLTKLLLRLSEGNEPAFLTGDVAKPFFGPEFQLLLHRRIIVEQAPATEWPACESCECDHHARRIEARGNSFVAACPLDARQDERLDVDDLRSFDIDRSELIAAISLASGFTSLPEEIVNGVWFLGQTPSRRAVFVALRIDAIDEQPTLRALRAMAPATSITVLAPRLRHSTKTRLEEAQIGHLNLADVLASDHLAFDTTALDSITQTTPRLVIDRSRQTATLDGSVTQLTPRSLKLLGLLAAAVLKDGHVVSRREIETGIWGKSTVDIRAAADAVRTLRRELAPAIRAPSSAHDLIRTRPTQGYVLTLSASEIQLIE